MSSYRKSLRTTFAAFHASGGSITGQYRILLPKDASDDDRQAAAADGFTAAQAGLVLEGDISGKRYSTEGFVESTRRARSRSTGRTRSISGNHRPRSAWGCGFSPRRSRLPPTACSCWAASCSCRSRQLRSTRTAASGSCKGVRYERNRSTTMTASPLHAPPLGLQLSAGARCIASSKTMRPNCSASRNRRSRAGRRAASRCRPTSARPPSGCSPRASIRPAITRSRGSSRAARAACISCATSRTACSRLPRRARPILAAAVDVARHVAVALRDA